MENDAPENSQEQTDAEIRKLKERLKKTELNIEILLKFFDVLYENDVRFSEIIFKEHKRGLAIKKPNTKLIKH